MKKIETEEEWISALSSPINLLLVEDDEYVQDVFKMLTHRYNCVLEIFRDAESALDHFVPGKYNVILLDVRLPGMSGIDLFKLIHSKDNKAIIAIFSGWIDNDVRSQLDGYVVTMMEKPTDFTLGKIEDWFNRIGIPKINHAKPL